MADPIYDDLDPIMDDAAKDKRIAELEAENARMAAALKAIVTQTAPAGEDWGNTTVYRIADDALSGSSAALDGMLAEARREALAEASVAGRAALDVAREGC